MPSVGWAEAPPLRSPAAGLQGTLLGDVDCHLPAGHPYGDSDKVTWAHEATHGVNGRLRMRDGGWNCFYTFHDRAFWLLEPNFRKRDVIQFIRTRGRNFSLYVSGQTAWDKQPLYLLDEWSAYTNGSEAGLDLARQGKWRGGRRHDTIENMNEFSEYARAVGEAQQQLDPTYEHAAQLRSFLVWNQWRVDFINQDCRQCPDFAPR